MSTHPPPLMNACPCACIVHPNTPAHAHLGWHTRSARVVQRACVPVPTHQCAPACPLPPAGEWGVFFSLTHSFCREASATGCARAHTGKHPTRPHMGTTRPPRPHARTTRTHMHPPHSRMGAPRARARGHVRTPTPTDPCPLPARPRAQPNGGSCAHAHAHALAA